MRINKKSLKNKLNINILQRLENDSFEMHNCKAKDLLTSNRFDLLAKYIYVKFKDKNIDSNFGKEIYLEHIKAFNGFVENDKSSKIGKEAFLNSFDNLILSIKTDGLKTNIVIPVSKEFSIIDGAHRAAASIYYNLEIEVVDTNLNKQNFNYTFFKQRGLSEIYLDAMAHEYTKLKDNCFMVIIWPKAYKKESELESILKKYGSIVYHKNIVLNSNGMVHLVKQAYRTETWVGNYNNDFEGARNKARWCYREDGLLRAYLLESNQNLIKMKEEIRDLFQLEKHAIHINDTKEETLELAELLFNEHSIHWMNTARLKKFNIFHYLFNQYSQHFQKLNLDSDDFCLVGGVLSVYGVKETNDIDYINSKNLTYNFNNKNIELETNKILFTEIKVDDIIYNRKYHFIAFGQKFISLKLIRDIKKKRQKGSDEEDVILLNKLMANGIYKESLSDFLKKFGRISFWKRNIKFALLKIRLLLLVLLKNLRGK